jgi:hypothetical protein
MNHQRIERLIRELLVDLGENPSARACGARPNGWPHPSSSCFGDRICTRAMSLAMPSLIRTPTT